MARYILALDQGTTSSRAILFDRSGNAVASAQREFPQHFPQPGWVEHDPQDIWTSQRDTISKVLATAKASARDIAAIGIANQRETTMMWDKRTGEPIGRAIVWQDRRTAEMCEKLAAAGHEPEISRRTGLVLDPYFSGTKLAWLLDSEPGARARAERGELAFGTIDSWLIWRLTDGAHHVTDATNASRTLLFNLHTRIGTPCCWPCSMSPQPACRGSCPLNCPPKHTSRQIWTDTRFPSQASQATSRPRSSASAASSPAWRRTPTAPAASCS